MGRRSKKKAVGRGPAKEEAELTSEVHDMLKELDLPAASEREKLEAMRQNSGSQAEIESGSDVDSDEDSSLGEQQDEQTSRRTSTKPTKMEESSGSDGSSSDNSDSSNDDDDDDDDDSEDDNENNVADNTEQPVKDVANGKHITFDYSDDESEEGSNGSSDDEKSDNGLDQDESAPRWFEEELAVLQCIPEEQVQNKAGQDYDAIGKLRDRAEQILSQRSQRASTEIKGDEEVQWMQKMMRSGTMSDKIAAMALLVTKSPVGGLDMLDNLIAMAGKKGRREAQLATNALADLFCNSLLPPDRPLVGFNDQVSRLTAAGRAAATDKHLLRWSLEGEIKSKYLQFVRCLEQWSFDTIEFTKRNAVSTACKLLKDKPEQEQQLLILIVQKLGDSEKRVASHVVYLLTELLKSHPNMRLVVAAEVERYIFRKKSAANGIYYGTVFLNQIVLQRQGDEELAQKLIEIYIRLFRDIVRADGGLTLQSASQGKENDKANGKKKRFTRKGFAAKHRKKQAKSKRSKADEDAEDARLAEQAVRSRLLAAALTGVNRAFPYANSKGESFAEEIDTLFEMVHVGTFNTATQVLLLLLHIMLARNAVSDRFYRSLYSKLLSPELRVTSKQTMFLNVLFRSIKHDTDANRVRAFLKRILQVASGGSAAFAAGALVLVSGVIQSRKAVLGKLLREGNDEMDGTVSPTFKNKAKRGPSSDDDDSGDSDDESDDDDDDDGGDDDSGPDDSSKKSKSASPKLLIDGDNSDEESESNESKSDADVDAKSDDDNGDQDLDASEDKEYDPSKRDPRYAGCNASTRLWEIELFCRHYHPTVRTFASALLKNPNGVQYTGDPLRDLSSNAFLDRFVYRNPRQRDVETLRSGGKSVFGKGGRIGRMGKKVAAQAVNSAKFILKDKSQVGVEERFFHEFFYKKAANEGKDLRAEMAERLVNERKKGGDPFLRDEEAEFDEYATQLAHDMMRKAHGDPDIDDDADIDFDYDNQVDDLRAGRKKSKAADDADVFDDGDDSSDDDSDSDSDSNMELGTDEDDDDVLGEDSDEDQGIMNLGSGPKKGKNTSAFADVEQFAQLLEESGKASGNKRERQWEERVSSSDHADRRKSKGGSGSKRRRK